ncbi:MAG: metallophosphoesterase family protein [Firmicutes bacterium]|nr:metallophosphoesterase family protein [Bacillota bacterium]
MFTKQRLDDLFSRSEKISFDNTSRLVFMSDVHRGDNSAGDEFGQNKHIYYHALEYYYENDFTYVEVGDGDELWETANYEYIHSSHPLTFELMREFHLDNRLIMLWGNHNIHMRRPEYVKKHMDHTYDDFLDQDIDLFPGLRVHEAVTFVYEETGQEIFVCHGHQGEIFNDYLWRIPYFFCRYFWRFLHKAGINYAASPAKNRYKRAKQELSMVRWLQTNDLLLICGHTHRPRLPLPEETRYFNTGCCIHPRGITALEIEFGEISLVNWQVHSRKDGMMYVRRSTIKGPFEIKEYLNNNTPRD